MLIEIPDNATNGEVVKAVFSEISKDEKYPVVYQFDKTTNKREILCDLFDDIWCEEYKKLVEESNKHIRENRRRETEA